MLMLREDFERLVKAVDNATSKKHLTDAERANRILLIFESELKQLGFDVSQRVTNLRAYGAQTTRFRYTGKLSSSRAIKPGFLGKKVLRKLRTDHDIVFRRKTDKRGTGGSVITEWHVNHDNFRLIVTETFAVKNGQFDLNRSRVSITLFWK